MPFCLQVLVRLVIATFTNLRELNELVPHSLQRERGWLLKMKMNPLGEAENGSRWDTREFQSLNLCACVFMCVCSYMCGCGCIHVCMSKEGRERERNTKSKSDLTGGSTFRSSGCRCHLCWNLKIVFLPSYWKLIIFPIVLPYMVTGGS